MIEQRTFGAPLGSVWNPRQADPAGYVRPSVNRPRRRLDLAAECHD